MRVKPNILRSQTYIYELKIISFSRTNSNKLSMNYLSIQSQETTTHSDKDKLTSTLMPNCDKNPMLTLYGPNFFFSSFFGT